ncbi:DUF1310 family protein [Weissella muntiaci]|uniref:DUF1310 family protein n=1 Tax=Weissella muntiaci TaxID=2508881 RepID=A0A6C2C1J1_9LACO|nr:DUF1310 family protein [Weissella muntiaci]TYC47858.1 DUF1310 family protein [Weissella muntiaci]
MKKIPVWGWAILILVVIGGVIGGKTYMDNQAFQKEMIKVAHSDEAKRIYEDDLKDIDPNALTEKGVIRSYKIDTDKIEHNPMGGITVVLVINDDATLTEIVGLDKDNGKLEYSNGGTSAELYDLTKNVKR